MAELDNNFDIHFEYLMDCGTKKKPKNIWLNGTIENYSIEHIIDSPDQSPNTAMLFTKSGNKYIVKGTASEWYKKRNNKYSNPTQVSRVIDFSQDIEMGNTGALANMIIRINEIDDYYEYFCVSHKLNYTRKPITIYINSGGGSAYGCLAFIDVVEQSKTPIHTVAAGICASAAFLIFITGHKRYTLPHSSFMYHQMILEFDGKLIDMKEDLVESERMQKMFEDHVLKHTKISYTKLKEVYNKKKDWFLTAEEAVKFGVADEI